MLFPTGKRCLNSYSLTPQTSHQTCCICVTCPKLSQVIFKDPMASSRLTLIPLVFFVLFVVLSLFWPWDGTHIFYAFSAISVISLCNVLYGKAWIFTCYCQTKSWLTTLAAFGLLWPGLTARRVDCPAGHRCNAAQCDYPGTRLLLNRGNVFSALNCTLVLCLAAAVNRMRAGFQ